MAEHPAHALSESIRGYRVIARMWIRASMAYPASFWMMAASNFVVGGLDFIGIWIIFHTVDSLGGFGLAEIAFLYGATGLALASADAIVGRVERLGVMVRLGKLDAMFLKPLPLLAQVCSDEFALRRLARVAQTGLILGVACSYVDWTPARVAVTVMMVVCGSVIFFSLFVALACLQFWTADASEVANAFTYGGNTLTQYPLTIFPKELVKGLTFMLPLAFVNWYPSLYVLGRDDPFGLPSWLQLASPLAALAMAGVATVAWRQGVRHYSSTGS